MDGRTDGRETQGGMWVHNEAFVFVLPAPLASACKEKKGGGGQGAVEGRCLGTRLDYIDFIFPPCFPFAPRFSTHPSWLQARHEIKGSM